MQRGDDAAPRQAEGRPQPDRDEPERPEDERQADARDDRAAVARIVVSARAEPVLAVSEDDRRDDDRERERERQRREGDDLAGDLEGRVDPDGLRPEPEREPEEEVARGTVEQATDERDNRDDEPVDGPVVHHVPTWPDQHRGHAREDRERKHRLGPRVDVDLVGLREGREHRLGAVRTRGTLRHHSRAAASPASANRAPWRSACSTGLTRGRSLTPRGYATGARRAVGC